MAKVITMGEIMLRLSTPNNEKFIQADEFDVNYGGGEANVAVSLANYGHDAEFVTAVPDNEIGECAVAALRKYNVETKHIARCGERLGIYYLESGSSMRPSKVVYDRAHSSISTATEADFNFDEIFEGADWFHFTGITPAVSDAAAELTEKALIAAKKHGVKVSVDLNFRKKLWSSEKAQKVMTNLMKYVDVCIGNEEDAELVLGFKPGDTDVTSGELELAGYKSIFEQMVDKFNFEYCVSSLRVSHSASDNGWSACIYSRDTKEFYHSKEYSIHPIVDRVGGGDSFAGGVICGIGAGMTLLSGGSGGGEEILGLLLMQKHSNLSVGKVSAILNIFIFGTCAVIFSISQAIYSVLFTGIVYYVLDKVHFQNIMLTMLIITKKQGLEKIIFEKVNRGVTKWNAYGAYRNEEREILMTVVSKSEFLQLRRLLLAADPEVFIIIEENVFVVGNFQKRVNQ